jgi:hypothetical protein
MAELMTKLEDAVHDFVSSLSVTERETVRRLVLNPQMKPSLDWYNRVVARYLQTPSAALLIEDISRKYADEAVWRELDSPSGVPLFEAGIILRESQVALGSAAGG